MSLLALAGALAGQQSLFLQNSLSVQFAQGSFRHSEDQTPRRRDQTSASRIALEALLGEGAGLGLRIEGLFSDGNLFRDTPGTSGATRSDELGAFVYWSHAHREDALTLRYKLGYYSQVYINDDPANDNSYVSSHSVRLELLPSVILIEGEDARLELLGMMAGFTGLSWLANDQDDYHDAGRMFGYDLSLGLRLGFTEHSWEIGWRQVFNDYEPENSGGRFEPFETEFQGIFLSFTGRF